MLELRGLESGRERQRERVFRFQGFGECRRGSLEIPGRDPLPFERSGRLLDDALGEILEEPGGLPGIVMVPDDTAREVVEAHRTDGGERSGRRGGERAGQVSGEGSGETPEKEPGQGRHRQPNRRRDGASHGMLVSGRVGSPAGSGAARERITVTRGNA